jgi:hypothetical protein
VVDLVAEAARLETFLKSQGWRFCFIGGLAVQHWGEPRLTRDIDLSLLTGFGGEASYIDSLLGAYPARIADARAFALARRVLLLRTPGGVGIDISLAALPYEETAVSRAVPIELAPGCVLSLCSPEDLLVMKLFASRATDLRDARSVVVRQGAGRLDWPYIETPLAGLAELRDDIAPLDELRRLQESIL